MKRFVGLVARNLGRNPRRLALSSAGVVLGLSTFVFFVALGQGLRRNVLEQVFVVNQFEVVPPSLEIGAIRTRGLFGGPAGFTDADLREIAAHPDVRSVFPKQNIAFPAFAFGGESILGETLWTELVGDGIPPELVGDELGEAARHNAFVDWEALEACEDSAGCAPGSECLDGACVPQPCVPEDEIWAAADASTLQRLADVVAAESGIRRRNLEVRDSGSAGPASQRYRLVVNTGETEAAQEVLLRRSAREGTPVALESSGCSATPSYCQADERVCRMPVPVVVSRVLLELYNANIQGVLATASGAPRVPQLGENAFIGLSFGARLGEGFLGEARARPGQPTGTSTIRLRVVGFSKRAIPIGVTVPLPYVQRWNTRWGPEDREELFDSVLVETVDSRALGGVADHVTRELGWALDPRYQDAQRASVMLTLVTGGLALLSALILGLAALNVMNTFLMLVGERRREIGVLRALGATRQQVASLVLTEALAIAWSSWVMGLAIAVAAMVAADRVFADSVPDFPFKPDSLFDLDLPLLGVSLAVATISCVAGAWLPARRAARLDPTEATRGT